MGKLELNKKKKKNDLYNTAFELFTTKGIAKTTISDIVDKAGVAKGTFYLYFKDKYDIRNKLISHKAGELFSNAHAALMESPLAEADCRTQLHFIVDHVLDKLSQNPHLLVFISKNLAWGIFRSVFEEIIPEENPQFYQSFLDMMSQEGKTSLSPELALFTIIEMVGATCYSCILYSQPVSLEEYLPHLHCSIDAVLDSFSRETPS